MFATASVPLRFRGNSREENNRVGGGGRRRENLHGLARYSGRADILDGKVQHLRLPRPRPRARGDPGMPGEEAEGREEG